MSKRRCRENKCCGGRAVVGCGGNSAANLCTNPICAVILLIILQRTCLLENKNAFLLILLFLGFCFCRGGYGGYGGNAVKSCGC
ncbi:hypothetical protein E4V42_18250 [Clostridium estertheticum]|uniref:Uncharacterized protein n=1 Tax=Clostridium estertheticum TaxID=238834 RepID=A0A5N7ISS2_9CLOT|nr:hypothetical protein [Clostridium estertheticum]MPQ33368.1 hypothetical protein [Clostridium estertheticum]MPQ64026.1 hypothetical protein [Clostridium estertheticum]